MKKTTLCLVGLCVLGSFALCVADEYATLPRTGPPAGSPSRYPQESWEKYAAPEEAGWSSSKLNEARKFSDEIGSAAVMIVHDGAVIAAWGDVERRYMCHSMRKSLLSALYGVHVQNGDIRLNATIGELDIDDKPPLTEKEKTARVVHLLASRSGVYHPAAYETSKMKNQRPKRGSHEPGEYFWYNNWDFNTLCTIFEQQTDTKVFDEFQKRFAIPTAMQDFRLGDCYYHLESQHSVHPAYPFRMSARDLARFGLLFLRQGRWQDKQILSERWVKESTRSHLRKSETASDLTYGYGFLWWRIINGPLKAYGMYSARGYGGHAIDVLPGANLVVVHRVNTFWDLTPPFVGATKARVTNTQRFELLNRILGARLGEPKPNPKLVPLRSTEPAVGSVKLSATTLRKFARKYDFGEFTLSVIMKGEDLFLNGHQMGTFGLQPRTETEFILEDIGAPVTFELDENGNPVQLLIKASPDTVYRGRPTT